MKKQQSWFMLLGGFASNEERMLNHSDICEGLGKQIKKSSAKL